MSIEVSVLGTDEEQLDFVADDTGERLADGTQLEIEDSNDPDVAARITFGAASGAAVSLLSFDASPDELSTIAGGLDIADDGRLSGLPDGVEATGRARLPFYTGGHRTEYRFDGGEVTIGSYVSRGDELEVFGFGPRDPAQIDTGGPVQQPRRGQRFVRLRVGRRHTRSRSSSRSLRASPRSTSSSTPCAQQTNSGGRHCDGIDNSSTPVRMCCRSVTRGGRVPAVRTRRFGRPPCPRTAFRS